VVAAKDSGNPGGEPRGLQLLQPAQPRLAALPKLRQRDEPAARDAPLRALAQRRRRQDYIALPSTKGIQIWNITNPLAPTLAKDMVISGITASDYADGTVVGGLAGAVHLRGGSGNGLYIVNATDPLNPRW
jgi:hypothetical protein